MRVAVKAFSVEFVSAGGAGGRILMGEHASVSLISSSRDEKAVGANYAQYGVGLLLLIQKARDTKK